MNDLARVEAEQRDGLTLVRVHGEIDLSNARDVGGAIEAAVPAESGGLVVDLSGTTYLDSAGISLLLRLADRLRPRRQSIRLVVPADSPVRAVLELTGVPAIIPLDAG